MECFEVYSKSIDPEIIKIIDNEIPYTATGLCYCAAKMFYLDKKDKEWKDMNLEGALVFVVDRVLNSRFIMMYSLQNYTKLFYTEMYVDFKKNWIKINDGFYAFPCEKMIVGISFGEKEGSIFDSYVQQFSISRSQFKKRSKIDKTEEKFNHLETINQSKSNNSK